MRARANHRCEYCQAGEWLVGQRFHVDHIIPRVLGGETSLGNLCLACPGCNGSKRDRTYATDLETGEVVPLFHPRRDLWSEHFIWRDNGLRIGGLTSSGRATVEMLKMNRPLAISAGAVWISVNRHPPAD